MSEVKEPDEWQLALRREKEKLMRCQEEKKVKSCMQCDMLLSCEIRDRYVQAVYDSMNKGTGGGFEF